MEILYSLMGAREQSLAKQLKELGEELAAQRRENQSLKHDLRCLKQTIANANTNANEVADDELKVRMEDIYQMSISWVRTNFRRPNTNQIRLSRSSQKQLSDKNIRLFISLNHAEKLKFAQAFIGVRMFDILNEFYYGTDVQGPFGSIVLLANSMRDGRGYDEWRSRTVMAFNRKDNETLQTAVCRKLVQEVDEVELLLSELFGLESDDVRNKQLYQVFENAVTLNHILGAQRVEYFPEMTRVAKFNERSMVDIDDVEGESSTRVGKKLKFILFPSLMKLDSVYGDTRHYIYLAKAKVYCSPV